MFGLILVIVGLLLFTSAPSLAQLWDSSYEGTYVYFIGFLTILTGCFYLIMYQHPNL